ncbi:OPT oligopeptide transporter protein-domain-containing protein [Aspergillus novoparasiticus]|uniref:OPT oligopeptide transporter protein-domain-containing protein n=1 Tax=Aspergillus novoparasiticus TaxID=986946 RepID=A0A5N6EMU0_9EURO|nr:OPT oligopeptide transporter protein-domain-containing protein [Aspergillus novoparasiticus]
MPRYAEAPADGSEVSSGSQLTKRVNKSEEPYETVTEQKATGRPRETDGEDSLGSRGDGDDVLYVKGHPVIRNGNRLCADVSKFIVSVRDDGDSSLTFRSIVLGSVFTALSSVITMLYVFKPYQAQVSAVFLQLLVYVFGEAWARLTPRPDRFRWKGLQTVLTFLNFGQRFTIKEHVVAALIASSGNNGLNGVEVYAVERLFYNRGVSATTAVLGTFSMALCGFVLAGIMRPLIVYPGEMVYWSTLPQVVLYQNLHFDRRANKDRLTKFGWAMLLTAVWELFPAYIMTWLSGFSIFCLASMNAPKHTRTIFSTIFGGASSNEGMGLLNFSLDWQYIQSTYLSLPIKQQLNTWLGYVILYAAILGLYYGNAWDAKTFPFMSTSLFQSNGTQFSTSAVINSQGTIDFTKLKETGLPSLTSATVWGYLTQNLAIGALITHVFIFYGKDMVLAWKQSRSKTQPDPHYQAMLKYKEVPMWWYLVLFVLAFVAGLIVNIKGETTLPVWGYIVSLLLGAFIAPFSCVLYGLYGTGVSTNQLSKMVAGALHPGRPLANLYFASWSHQCILLSVNLANWLKVGQYTKVPHRIMFATQIYGTLLGAALNYVVMTTIVSSQREILLDPVGNNVWSGSTIQGLNSQAITWALAKDMYGVSSRYFIVPLCLVIGLALPIVHWGLGKVIPRLRKLPLNTAIIVSYAGSPYYGNTSWIWSSIVVGLFSQFWLRRRLPEIYNKYNYLIGAAMDGGSQIIIFILSFAVLGAAGKERPFPTWWGNPQGNPDHCL